MGNRFSIRGEAEPVPDLLEWDDDDIYGYHFHSQEEYEEWEREWHPEWSMSDEKRKPPVTEQNKAILTPENKAAKASEKDTPDLSRMHPVQRENYLEWQRQLEEEKKREAGKRKS